MDADLGGGVIKQRIARPGAGRSGGFRSLILFRVGERAIFAFGFAKSALDNIRDSNLKALKILARTLLGLTEEQIQALVAAQELVEVDCTGSDTEGEEGDRDEEDV